MAILLASFIACVAHGLVFDVFTPQQTSKLLYAAQVATTAELKRYRPREN